MTKAIHGAGGKIFLQLWHVGRISHQSYLNGETPVAPSADPAKGSRQPDSPDWPTTLPRAPWKQLKSPTSSTPIASVPKTPRPLVLTAWKSTAPTATCSTSSCKAAPTSAPIHYGGSLENRARLLLEVTDAAIEVWGAGRVGVHLAPRADSHDMGDDNLAETFTYVASELGKRGIAFICSREKEGADSLGHS